MNIREQHVQHELNSCVHFNGVGRGTCKAGVVYHDLMGNGVGCFAHLPCLKDDESPVRCPQAKFPTREEAEKEADEWMERVERHGKCLKAAHAHAKAAGLGRGHGGTGSMPCPSECGGTLRYSVASVNGHMHAARTTKGCVRWME